jgi:hypothetical protein
VEKHFGFYDTAARALEIMNGKIAARWVPLDGRLPDWLATLRAGVVVKWVERHRELLSCKANRRHAKGRRD